VKRWSRNLNREKQLGRSGRETDSSAEASVRKEEKKIRERLDGGAPEATMKYSRGVQKKGPT